MIKSKFNLQLGRVILLWSAGITLALLSLFVIIFQLSALIINDNPHYKQRIMSFLQEQTNLVIEADDMSLGWGGGTLASLPTLNLHNIKWHSPDDTVSIESSRASVGINLLAYIYKGPLLNVNLQQGDLIISQDGLGGEGDSDISNIRIGLTLNNFRVRIKENDTLVVHIAQQKMELANGKLRSIGQGDMKFGDKDIMNFRFAFNLGGEEEDSGLYLAIKDITLDEGWQKMLAKINLPQDVYADVNAATSRLEKLVGQGKLWINFNEQGEIIFKTDIVLPTIVVNMNRTIAMDDVKFISRFTYNYNNPAHNWEWRLGVFEAMLNNGDADRGYSESKDSGVTGKHVSFRDLVVAGRQGRWSIIAPSANFEDISNFALQTVPKQNIVDNIAAYGTTGIIYDFSLEVIGKTNETASSFMLDGRVEDMSINAVSPIPGATNISGNLALRNRVGWFELDDYNSNLLIPELYSEPFIFGYAKGLFMWEWLEPGELIISGEAHDIRDGDMRASMEMDLHSMPRQHGYIDLVVGMQQANMQQTRTFIPWLSINPRTAAWLDKSLQGGLVNEVALSMKADVKDMTHPQTIFELAVAVQDGVLQYSDDRLPIKAKQFDIFMDSDRLVVQLPQGAEIGKIANMTNGYGVVTLSSGDFTLGGDGIIDLGELPYLLTSYLLDEEEQSYEWNSGGTSQGNWDVKYNLRSGNFQGVNFDVDILDAQVGLPDSAYEINDINGRLSFSDTAGYGGGFTGTLGDNSLNANFLTRGKQNFLQMEGTFVTEDYLPEDIGKYISGESDFVLNLYAETRGGLGFSEYLIESDLHDLELQLPYPLSKSRTDKLPTKFFGKLDTQESFNYLQLGNRANINWKSQEGNLQGLLLQIPAQRENQYNSKQIPDLDAYFDSAPISSGLIIEMESSPDKSAGASHITNITAWADVAATVGLMKAKNPDDKTSIIVTLNKLFDDLLAYRTSFPYWDIKLTDIEWQNKQYDEITVNYDSDTYPWIEFALPAINGRLFAEAQPRLLTIEINNVYLPKKDENEEKGVLDGLPQELKAPTSFAGIPIINLTLSNIFYDGIRLGNINLFADAIHDNELVVEVNNSVVMGLTTEANFAWLLQSPDRSAINIAVASEGDLPAGFISTLVADDVDLDLHWNWKGLNKEFNNWYETSTGSLIINAGKGSLASNRVNVLTNLFSLLNIDNLGDRATGDFSDISTSKLTFRRIRSDMNLYGGNFTIEDEVTADFSFLNIRATGSYTLRNRQLHHRVTVSSPTSKILPIAALLLGASSAAPLLLSLDLAGGEFINRFSSAVYNINGTLNNPQSSLAQISDVAGEKLEPEDLANQVDVQSRLRNLNF